MTRGVALEKYISIGAAALFAIGVVITAIGSVVGDWEWNPYSLVVVMPATVIAGLLGETTAGSVLGVLAGSSIVPILYLLSGRRILKRDAGITQTAKTVFFVIATLSVILAVSSWNVTAQYTSTTRATALVAQSIVPIALLLVMAARWSARMSKAKTLGLYWGAYAWLAWSAFPWYGELM